MSEKEIEQRLDRLERGILDLKERIDNLEIVSLKIKDLDEEVEGYKAQFDKMIANEEKEIEILEKKGKPQKTGATDPETIELLKKSASRMK